MESLSKVYTSVSDSTPHITISDMVGWGLSGSKEAAVKRTRLCEELNIGYANAGQLRKKLNRYGIKHEQIEDILKAVEGE
ncbi:DUF4093 domain-containing protein [Salinicoccus sp. CNSTN-B1]